MKNRPVNGPFVYVIYDSMGRRTSLYVIADNLPEACKKAKERIAEIGSAYYKVKRAYDGGQKG